jgi:hypothetical protein
MSKQEKYSISNTYSTMIDLMNNHGSVANAIYFIDELYPKLNVDYWDTTRKECIEAVKFLQDNLNNAYDDDIHDNYLDNWIYAMNNVFIISKNHEAWILGERSEYDGSDTLYMRRYITLENFTK